VPHSRKRLHDTNKAEHEAQRCIDQQGFEA
jgi:hypothetical protein